MQANYEMLNDRQKEAVLYTEGPLLILAGAGAGKTRVLTHRIAYLIEEKNVAPYHIMAITFTNKAAQEMKNRVLDMVDFGDAVWVSTFHSSCVRILRRYIDRLGYDTDFTIYDTDDQKTLLKHVIKDLGLDQKVYKERALIGYISNCKNEMLTPEDMVHDAGYNRHALNQAHVYEEYQKRLKKNNAADFDDLLLLTVQLFKTQSDVLEQYQERFRYIMVDEYQDTNHVQFEFVRLLAGKYRNICVVGDDDQSIYRFRGADIRNILEFEEHFPGAKVVRLEQNYRSTTHILDCANAVIQNNRGRKEKHLWSALGEGADVSFRIYENGYEEAEEVLRKIRQEVLLGASYKDFAILYRTNAQSRAFEEKCIALNVPYRMVGGVNFYQRAEIKDLVAYLKTIATGRDDIATQRILNVPKRGIGTTTVDKLMVYAARNGMSLMEAIRHASDVPGVERAVPKLQVFAHIIGELHEEAKEGGFDELIKSLIEKTDYLSTLDDLDEERAEAKKENINELISKARDFEAGWEEEREPELMDLLEDIALVADVDEMDDSEDRVLLMTLHSSKGLEFPTVFLCGMEDGLFPSYMSLESGDPMDLEEERRLCYVGITRAMRHLYLSCARARTVRGEIQYNKRSRFIDEIPDDLLDQPKPRKNTYFSDYRDEEEEDDGEYSYIDRRGFSARSYESSRNERNRNERERGFGSQAFRRDREDSGSGSYGGRSSYGFGSDYSGRSSYRDWNDSRSDYGSYERGRAGSSSGSSGFGRQAPKESFGKSFEVKKPNSLDYSVGDRVHHIKFGDGTVKEITEGKKDFEVLVNFDRVGDKRMFASFAKLQKIQ